MSIFDKDSFWIAVIIGSICSLLIFCGSCDLRKNKIKADLCIELAKQPMDPALRAVLTERCVDVRPN